LPIDTDLMVSIPAPLPSEPQDSEEYDFKFPARVVRVENGMVSPNKKVSVRFAKLLYEK